MFWFNMGPRARRAARRGFHPGMMIPLFLFLFFGGWSIIAVMVTRIFWQNILPICAIISAICIPEWMKPVW